MTNLDPYVSLASEIMECFQQFGRSDNEDLDLGEVLSRVVRIADDFRRAGNCEQAIKCCKNGLDLIKESWTVDERFPTPYARGVLLLCSATTHLRQVSRDYERLRTALEQLRESADAFKAASQPRSEGVVWLALGLSYSRCQKEQWNALGAFHRSLAALEFCDFDPLVAELKQEIRHHLEEVEANLRDSGHEESGSGIPSASPDNQPSGTLRDQRGNGPSIPDLLPAQSNGPSLTPYEKPKTRAFRRPREKLISIPVVAKIAAGEPLLAYEDPIGPITLDANHANGATLALVVAGNSMVNAGIRDGDYALIRQQPKAENGEIVAAMISYLESEATLKRFYHRSNYVLLKPENDHEKWRIVTEDEDSVEIAKLIRRLQDDNIESVVLEGRRVDIIGKMVGLLRVL